MRWAGMCKPSPRQRAAWFLTQHELDTLLNAPCPSLVIAITAEQGYALNEYFETHIPERKYEYPFPCRGKRYSQPPVPSSKIWRLT